jgi:predicted PurR-regulated permease PerM
MATSQYTTSGREHAAGDDAGAGGRDPQADSDVMQEAVERAAAAAEETGGLGKPGRPLDRRSPFFIGMMAAAGVAVTYGLAELVIRARSVLVLIGLALFIAAGLDPAVRWLTRRRLPRWTAVMLVLAAVVGVIAIFLVAAIPPLTSQATTLAGHVPQYLHALKNPRSDLGRLNLRYHIEQRVQQTLSSRGTTIAGGILGAGEVVLSTAT